MSPVSNDCSTNLLLLSSSQLRLNPWFNYQGDVASGQYCSLFAVNLYTYNIILFAYWLVTSIVDLDRLLLFADNGIKDPAKKCICQMTILNSKLIALF